MAKIKQIIFIILLTYNYSINAQQIIVGAERTNLYFPLLKNKNVALVGNQTSTINDTHLVDSLINSNIDIKKIFCPEHGFRGEADAGEKIQNSIDVKTGIPIVSLYGKMKKPTKKQLDGINLMIFDIQDVGVRFYTYISTLNYIMEACANANIKLIILDRPNPNAHYIDGPVLEKEFTSFVGMHPVPIVYGMTIGEYAKMINGERWIEKPCDLTVVKMKNYNHNKGYSLPVKPSPNLPNTKSINLYPSLCLFEGTNISIGRGTEYPFQQYGAPYLEDSYSFIPKSREGSKYPKYENIECFGNDLRFNDQYLTSIYLDWIIDCYNRCPKKEKFFNNFFDKLAGTKKLRKQIINGDSTTKIKNSWRSDIEKFKLIREKYLLY
ncbi:MAG: hypothetical protein CMD06_01430 [Flavobacteriales bacterium]|nr:hypothetical protein [Flavobacteriales bacterium]|tara:strand:+ start:1006 stop:2145 length:1140 start_codon:yes stop_codon:yes gene_type:complete